MCKILVDDTRPVTLPATVSLSLFVLFQYGNFHVQVSEHPQPLYTHVPSRFIVSEVSTKLQLFDVIEDQLMFLRISKLVPENIRMYI